MIKNPVRVLLTGGGSGGPTLPLLALAEEIIQQKNDSIFLFLGSKGGPERQMVEQAGTVSYTHLTLPTNREV